MKNKVVIGICMALLIIAVIVSMVIISKSNEGNPVDTKVEREESFYINGNVAKEGMEPLNKDMVLGDILQQVKLNEVKKLKGLSDIEANQLFDLDEYDGLEKKVAKYADNDEYTEIWLIKVSEKEKQAVEIFRMFEERIEDLKEEYKENAVISEMLNNRKNIITKQQAEIAIMIISTNATEVEAAVDIEFKG